ncbi:RHS repeat domain-containing protein [Enterobacter mori]
MNLNPDLHAGTPDVTVTGSAGTPLRTLIFLRHPDEAAAGTHARVLVSRTLTDIPARTGYLYGARPLRDAQGAAVSDAVTVSSLTGQTLSLHTADGDATLSLADTAGRPLWARNGQGTVTTSIYERPEDGGRLLSVTETPSGGVSRVRGLTRWRHGISDSDRRYNLAGTPLKQCDNAGVSAVLAVSLTGQPQVSLTQLLRHDAPLPDWPASEADLETAETELRELTTYNACGETLEQTRAAGILTSTVYDVAGAVSRVSVMPGDGITQVALSAVTRAADGRVLSRIAGNGLSQTYDYDPQTRRRKRHLICDAAGVPLSDLHYAYDPAGNMLTLCDATVDTVWHRNDVSGGERVFSYDTLYRLVRVESRQKVVSSGRRGPFPSWSADGSAGAVWVPYAETYTYDDGDNLIKTVREGNAAGDGRTRTTEISARSNRGVTTTADARSGEPHEAFLEGGLLKTLEGGRGLRWNADGTLAGVVRPGGGDDEETYSYSAQGTRVRKRSAQGGAEVRLTTYAGGCEWRQRTPDNGILNAGAVITEVAGMRVIRIMESGDLRWMVRWSWQDHQGSVSGEVDGEGRVASREEYTPYGESLGGDEAEPGLSRRARRYAGKERDATGLYYYGWRYYQPESGRWLSADPGGLADGINLFRFCRNHPIQFSDKQGLSPEDNQEDEYTLDHFFNEPRTKGYIELRKELAENSSHFTVGKLKIPRPFAKKETIFDSAESVRKADYPMVDGKLYRAHYGSTAQIVREGVLRNVDDKAQPEEFDAYLIKLFRHTAGHGSEGKVMSLSAAKNKSKKFMSEGKTLVTINVSLYDEDTKKLFISTPQLIIRHGARLYREGKINLETLGGAINQLNSKEHEFFFTGKTEGLRYGEISPDKVLLPKHSQSETDASFIRRLSFRNRRREHILSSV